MTFYEIENNEKLSNEDVSYIENEFNNLMFENDYESLFDFSKFKEFIKSIKPRNYIKYRGVINLKMYNNCIINFIIN